MFISSLKLVEFVGTELTFGSSLKWLQEELHFFSATSVAQSKCYTPSVYRPFLASLTLVSGSAVTRRLFSSQ